MNFLLLSAAVCANRINQADIEPVTDETDKMPMPAPVVTGSDGKMMTPPIEDIFKILGPVNGVCSSEFNKHPLSSKPKKDDISGKWKTILVDAEMLNRNYVPQCMSAEIFTLDGQDSDELIFRVGELHQLKDEETGKEVDVYSGQTMTLLFDNMEVPEIANQYSYQPTNKFTQFLDVGLEDVMVTMTCVQIRGIAPPQMIQELAKQQQYAEMRGNMQMAEEIYNEMQSLSTGQMINMYEVHVKDMAKYETPEKIEELKQEVSEALELSEELDTVNLDENEEVSRLMKVKQDPKICAVT